MSNRKAREQKKIDHRRWLALESVSIGSTKHILGDALVEIEDLRETIRDLIEVIKEKDAVINDHETQAQAAEDKDAYATSDTTWAVPDDCFTRLRTQHPITGW